MRGFLENLRVTMSTRRNRVLALSAFAAAILAITEAHERMHSGDAERMLNAVVVIQRPSGSLAGGGVVLVGGRYVLTVNHVIDDMADKGDPIVVRYRDGTMAVTRLIKRNTHFDIALLEVPEWHANGLNIVNDRDVQLGEHVRAIGHPHSVPWVLSDGIVSRKSYYPPTNDGSTFNIWTTAWIESGSSGGPLVNDKGEIVGLATAFVNYRGVDLGAQHMNLCVSGSEILRFLEN